MEERNIYHDISERTNGDIYIGVVGPVRTGKSTFIKRFMDTIVCLLYTSFGKERRRRGQCHGRCYQTLTVLEMMFHG